MIVSAPSATFEAARREGLPSGSRLQSTQLSNGLQVLAAEVPEARRLRLVGAVGVGYLDEPMAYRGLAHLLEHALFLGSDAFPGESELSQWVGHLGGRYNASTDETTTDVHLHLPPGAAEEGLARLVDLLCRPLLVRERIEHEVGVLDAEYRARLADPALHRLAALGRLYRPGHPARACHAGNQVTLGQDAGRLVDQLHDFYRRHYRPERMALVMLGPLPLEDQLELLKRQGHEIHVAAASPSSYECWGRTSRWGEPSGVAWCLPQRLASSSPTSTLELLWPLPEGLARAHPKWLAALAARLADGSLASTLQTSFGLEALDVSLSSKGVGQALGIRLGLAELKPHHGDDTASLSTLLATLLATCHAALDRALQQRLPRPPRVTSDLDDWPRRQALRLITHAPHPEAVDTMPPRAAFATWLTRGQCRWLWHCPSPRESIGDIAWKTLEETGTRYCRLSLSPPLQVSALPPRAAPRIASEPSPSTAWHSMPGCLQHDRHLTLWWGWPTWPSDEPEASWCLGWPADPTGHVLRLAHWQRRCLALRQAAAAHDLTLMTGSDHRGDWLLAWGDPSRLPSVVEQALGQWSTFRRDDSPATSHPATGLIAQRLLCELETSPIPGATGSTTPHSGIAKPTPTLLCWARGSLDAEAARQQAHRFAGLLPNEPPWHTEPPVSSERETIWLTPQGTDQAVMLDIAGRDDTPRSRFLLQLVAQCHDAAFQHAMRQRHGFGYVAAVRYREAAGWPRLGYVVQSPHASVETVRLAIDDFLQDQGVSLARLESTDFSQRLGRLAASQARPETRLEGILRIWQALRHRQLTAIAPEADDASWQVPPWEEEQEVLAALVASDLTALADALVVASLPRRWWLHAPQ